MDVGVKSCETKSGAVFQDLIIVEMFLSLHQCSILQSFERKEGMAGSTPHDFDRGAHVVWPDLKVRERPTPPGPRRQSLYGKFVIVELKLLLPEF